MLTVNSQQIQTTKADWGARLVVVVLLAMGICCVMRFCIIDELVDVLVVGVAVEVTLIDWICLLSDRLFVVDWR